jgi:hypothetical protein
MICSVLPEVYADAGQNGQIDGTPIFCKIKLTHLMLDNNRNSTHALAELRRHTPINHPGGERRRVALCIINKTTRRFTLDVQPTTRRRKRWLQNNT